MGEKPAVEGKLVKSKDLKGRFQARREIPSSQIGNRNNVGSYICTAW